MEKPQIKIGTKDEALWIEVKEATEARITAFEKGLIIERAMLKLAKEKILLEQR